MVASTACPNPDRLRHFYLGLVTEAEGSLVEQHIADCPTCLSQLEMLSAAEHLGAAEPGSLEVLTRQAEQSAQSPTSLSAGETPPLDTAQAPVDGVELPLQIGRYQVKRLLGWGGMGTVYLAQDPDLDRLVAVKVPHFSGPQATQTGARQRFLREARAAARLQHAHIVQIHEVDERADGPFLALEYVSGGSLTEKMARKPLPARAAAQLVEVLARATQFAHANGVVHRDLKPANVLLTADGTPKITDYGLAKLQEDSDTATGAHGQTKTGAVIGTPSYMAPEQAEGKAIGPAVDVYALGAIFYETLTGRPPFLAESALETLAQVRSEEAVPPRQLQPRTPRDLETICLKCLHKEPKKRYASAEDLAEDLRRFLAGETIRARPAGPAERLWSWCRRRPAVASLLVTLILIVLGSLVVMTGLWRRAEHQREQAEANLTESNDNLDLARQAVDELTQEIEELLSLEEGLQPMQRRLLESALKYYQAFLKKRHDDPRIQKELAATYHRVAQIQRLLGNKKDALAADLEARPLREKLVKLNPGDAELELDLARTWHHMGALQYEMGEYDAAERSFEEALTILNRTDRPYGHWQWLLSNTWSDLGNVFRSQQKQDQALKCYEQSVALKKGLVVADGNQAQLQHDLAGAHGNIGVIYYEKGEHVKAGQAYQEAQTILEWLVKTHPKVSAYKATLAMNLTNTGVLQRKDAVASLRCYEQARTLLEEVVRANPKVARYQYELALAYNNLGALQQKTPGPAVALQSYEKARAILEDLLKGGETVTAWQQTLAQTCYNMSELQFPQNPAEALKSVDRARAILEEVVKSLDKDWKLKNRLALTYQKTADFHHGSGNSPAALEFYKKASVLLEELKGVFPKDPIYQDNLARASMNIGVIHRDAKNYAASLPAFQRALELQSRLVEDHALLPQYQFALSNTCQNLGVMHRRLDEFDSALRFYQQAGDILNKLVKEDRENPSYQEGLARLSNNIAFLKLRTKDFPSALENFRQACSSREKLPMDLQNLHFLGQNWNGVGQALEGLDRYAEAAVAYRQAVAQQQLAFNRARGVNPYRQFLNAHYRNVARCERLVGRPAEAAGASLERSKLDSNNPQHLHEVARELALCVPLVGKDKIDLTKEEHSEQLKYADQAMAMLRQAVIAKFDDLKSLKEDPSLGPLRKREDFQRLVAELEERKKNGSPPVNPKEL